MRPIERYEENPFRALMEEAYDSGLVVPIPTIKLELNTPEYVSQEEIRTANDFTVDVGSRQDKLALLLHGRSRLRGVKGFRRPSNRWVDSLALLSYEVPGPEPKQQACLTLIGAKKLNYDNGFFGLQSFVTVDANPYDPINLYLPTNPFPLDLLRGSYLSDVIYASTSNQSLTNVSYDNWQDFFQDRKDLMPREARIAFEMGLRYRFQQKSK